MKRRLSVLVAVLMAGMLWGGAVRAEVPTAQPVFVPWQGRVLHYLNYGQGDEALVFIHGWACDHTFWRKQAPELAKSGRVIALDLIGHGKSSKQKENYTLEYLARSVIAVLDTAGVKKAVLAGHSLGAPVSRLVARMRPELISGLIIVDGAFLMIPQDSKKLASWLARNKAFAAQFQGPDYAQKAEAFISAMFTAETTPELRSEILAKIRAVPQWVGASIMENFIDLNQWGEEPVRVPTLAVIARNSELPPHFQAYLTKLFPTLEYHEWVGASHFLMLERPLLMNGLINGFLRRHELAGRSKR